MNLDKVREYYTGHREHPLGNYKYNAVLVPIIEKDGELHIMYERRSRKLRRQPGEICFPGGRVEPGETKLECALRETEEETGIPKDKIEVVGEGNTVLSAGNGEYGVYSFIGIIPYEDVARAQEITRDTEEVEELLLVPVKTFVDMDIRIYNKTCTTVMDEGFPYDKLGLKSPYNWGTGRYAVLVSDFGDDDIPLWGLTLRMTVDVLENIGVLEPRKWKKEVPMTDKERGIQ